MTDIKVDLSTTTGQRIKFMYVPKDATEFVEMEGVVDLVNLPAIVIKPKGSTMVKLITIDQIDTDTIEIIPEKPRVIKAKRHDGVGRTNVRNHLLDRHGWGLAAVNNLTDEDAQEIHDKFDHSDYGHFHADRVTDDEA